MRKILITGASGGIAQAMVPLLKDDFLILVGRNKVKLETLYPSYTNKACYAVDMASEAAIAALLDQVYREHGAIDILVNNAGYAIYKDFEMFSDQEVKAMFEANLFSLMSFCRLVGQRMKEKKAGQIINIVSMSGKVASAKSSVYSASKFAAIGFSDTIRLELASHNVQVLTVNPGPVKTGFFDLADPDGSYQKSVQAFLLQPERVAKKIVQAMGTKKRELNLPLVLSLTHKFYSLFPTLADFLARTVFNFK